ncbi:MAG: aspartate--tRNA(Asn) ligase [Promethearchaeota archaeon]
MKTHSMSDLADVTSGTSVEVAGYVSVLRLKSKIAFIILADETGDVQVTVKSDNENLFTTVNQIKLQSFIHVKGEVVETKLSQRGYELVPHSIQILSVADRLPIEIGDNTTTQLPTRLDYRPLDLRSPRNQAIFHIQSNFVAGALQYLFEEGYLVTNTPCLVAQPSESGSEMFEIKYYDRTAYLRQDPQLHRQLTILGGFEKIVDFGPSWRAELSHTPRHICEHRGLAVEQAYIESEQDVMRVQENLVVDAFKRINEFCDRDLRILELEELQIPKTPFQELCYPGIYDILHDLGEEVEYGEDHSWQAEIKLGEYIKDNYDQDFLFVNRFPFAKKPFYVMRVDEDPQWARSVDLIFRGLEQSSGGQREHRYKQLIANAKEKDMREISWFTEHFKYGAPPHGGFCLGIERMTQALLKIQNIRETALFPRDPERLEP